MVLIIYLNRDSILQFCAYSLTANKNKHPRYMSVDISYANDTAESQAPTPTRKLQVWMMIGGRICI